MKKHIVCTPTSKQYGEHRFAHRGLAPRLSAWRCDLTALSQRYNLYFLASRTVIHVYEPGFPDQKLTADPILTLHPPETGVRGFGIDPLEPHSINRILVEYLGNEEVLLVACDDGDVIGYRTSTIHRALQRRHNKNEPVGEDDAHVFLHRNVGASAWGLAVHREARIIAISANTRKITVIAYALAEHTEDVDDSTSNTPGSSKSTSQLPFCRQNENVFQLYTTNNLPALSFYDSSGRWLLSSCIDGQTILWDLHLKHKAVTYQFGWCMSAKDVSITPWYGLNGFTCACPSASNVLHGAWGTIPLDARSAHYLSSTEEKALELEDVQECFVDATAQKRRFTAEPHIPPISHFVFDESENELSDVDDDETESLEEQTQESQLSDLIQDNQAFAQQQAIQNIPPESQNVPSTQQFLNNLLLTNRALETSRSAAKPYCAIERSSRDPGDKELEDPFIILTKEDIFLVQGPFRASKHIMSMQRPLHVGEWVPSLAPHDRHCFFSQIPELGVFIIGSPVGRAAVFSLYWTKDEGNPRRRYGFKLEYLLPFQADKENKVAGVPAERLIGVAVSPIQGMFDRPEETAGSVDPEQGVRQPRRWRLLMYYMNHTVLSFELSKPREDNGSDPEELVV